MDLQTQQKVLKLVREQADKLGLALSALKKIKKLQYSTSHDVLVVDASKIASDALREISDYGKNPEDL